MRAVAISDTATIVIAKADRITVCQWVPNIGWQLYGDKEISKELSGFITKNLISKDVNCCTFNEIALLARLYCAENTGTLEDFGNYLASF